MKKLNNILRYKYVLLIILTLVYVFLITKNLIYKTNYSEGYSEVNGYITNISIKEDKISLTIKTPEKINVTYYTKDDLNLKLGDYISASGHLMKPYNNTIFNLYNYKLYLMSNKIYFIKLKIKFMIILMA